MLDPEFLRHRWNSSEHLGGEGLENLLNRLAEVRTERPLDPSALAMAGALILLDGDLAGREGLRGQIAEALLNDPEAPALAEILAEIRRRGDSAEGHPLPAVSQWLAQPSCEAIPSLGL